ncbi:ribonuclease E activity regulator RraA [Myxococcota bacterium]|nr:ribonuclease E activity regulator RraA [Myxococcota bacterium]
MDRSFATADLCDQHQDELDVALPSLRDYGRVRAFHGPIATVKVFEDNALVRKRLEEPGAGRVLVVDGAGGLRTALVGDKLAQLGADNGWAGIIVHGCIRDSAAIAEIAIGVKALGTTPRKSDKRGTGVVDVPVTFAGVTFRPGEHVYADADGIVISKRALP